MAERNADYAKIVRNLRFETSAAKEVDLEGEPAPNAVDASQPSGSSASGSGAAGDWAAADARTPSSSGDGSGGSAGGNNANNAAPPPGGAGMREAEVLIWMGDFNYRCGPAALFRFLCWLS